MTDQMAGGQFGFIGAIHTLSYGPYLNLSKTNHRRIRAEITIFTALTQLCLDSLVVTISSMKMVFAV